MADGIVPANWSDFLSWEKTTDDVHDHKNIYVDVAGGDLAAGVLLGDIVYWYLPGKTGKDKLRVFKNGHYWIARRRYEHWEFVRLSPRQADSALKKLEALGLIIRKVIKYDGEPTSHIRLDKEKFLSQMVKHIENPLQNPHIGIKLAPDLPNGHNEHAFGANSDERQREDPITETSSETFSKSIKKLQASRLGDYSNSTYESLIAVAQDPDDWDDLADAIGSIWVTLSPANIQSLKITLLGLHPDHSSHKLANVIPPVTIEEVREFGAYYRHRNPDGSFPEAPAKVQKWIYELRELTESELNYKIGIIPLIVKVPGWMNNHQAKYRYLSKYYPEEIERIHSILELLKDFQKRNIAVDMARKLRFEDVCVTVSVPVPREIPDGKETYEFIQREYPDEAARIFRCVISKRSHVKQKAFYERKLAEIRS